MRSATDQEKKALGVPPAYVDVKVAVDPTADLIVTARTPKGKTFYKYNPAFIAKQAAKKYARVRKLEARAAKIEATIERDARDLTSADHAVAVTARLILLTGLRNGNDAQGEKESYGASNLKMEHCEVLSQSSVRLRFPGKHGVPQDHIVNDVLFTAYVVSRSGQALLFPHDANATLRYMKSVGAAKVHDLRTLRANVLAQALVDEIVKQGVPDTKKGKKALIKFVATKVSEALGNKPGQALKSYIDPKHIARIEEA